MVLAAFLAVLAQLPGAQAPEASYEIARAAPGAAIIVRDAPAGRIVAKLRSRTEFDSPRTFHVARHRNGWLGVTTSFVPNRKLGWIRDDPGTVSVSSTPWSVRADISRRTVQIRHGDELVKQIPVTVGRAGSETPSGTFSITDALAGRGLGPYYGCCLLALSGHQPNLPPGWIGGDRIAIHGTPGVVGEAASLGCLRASDHDMVALLSLVPLGAPVFIRR